MNPSFKSNESLGQTSAQEYHTLIASFAQAFWETDTQGIVVADSPSWRAYTGQSLEAWLGEGWAAAVHPDDQGYALSQWHEAALRLRPVDAEFRLQRPGGGWRWTNVRATPILNADGSVKKWLGINIDIQDKKEAEAVLLRSEEKYRTLFESIDEGVAIVEVFPDQHGRITDMIWREANLGVERHAGIGNWVGKRASEIVPHLEQDWLDAMSSVYQTGESVRMEAYNADLGRWIDTYYSRVGGAGSLFIAAVFQDITERKQRLEKQAFLLRFSDALRAHSTADGVANQAIRLLIEQLQLDRSYITTYHLEENRAVLDYQIGNDSVPALPDHFVLSDYPEAFKAVSGQTFIIEDDYERQGLTEEERRNSEKLGMRAMVASTVRMGQNRPLCSMVAISSRPRRWSSNEIKLVEEVAERTWSALEKVRIEETLQKTEERTRLAIEAANLATWEWDLTTNEVYWNEQHFELLGLNVRPNPLPAEVFINHLHPDDADSIKAQLQTAIDERSLYDAEFRVIKEDGIIRWMSGYGRVMDERDGQPLRASGVMFDVTEQKEAQQALQESENRLSAIFESLPVGIGVVNKQGRITHCNKEMEYFVPTCLMPSLDKNQRNRWQAHDEQGEEIKPENFPGARALRGERVLPPIEMLYTPEKGNPIWTHVSAVPIGNSQGVVTGQMVVISNINELKRTERILKESDQRKNEFLAMLAHELRNPMATLSNGLQILSMTAATNAQARTVVDRMTRQTDHLVRMIDDLLDISRISQGKIDLKKERINLNDLAKQAYESVQVLVEQKHQTLTVHMPEEPIQIQGDTTRLVQVIMNLLTNANRYTPTGGMIKLSLEQSENQAIIRVSDTGIGLAADQLSKIFELFVQVDHSLGRSQGGLGLGLTLVKQIVELHDGCIEAQSEGLGQGSTFIVRMPALYRSNNAEETSTKPTASYQLPKLLIVDDNPDSSFTLSILLELKGYEVHTYDSGPAALESLESRRPDMILLDIGMPGMDGYETCQLMRQQASGAKAFIIAVSGYGQESDKQKAQESGFDEHITKPIDIEALIQIINNR